MKQVKEFSLTNFELQNLFRARLNQDQIHYFSAIIKILAKYMVLDRTMLEHYAKEKIGLSYLTNAVNWGLVTELKYKDDKEEKDIFHFHLNTAGIVFAEEEGFLVNKLKLSADHHTKGRVVTFNKCAIAMSYELLENSHSVGSNYEYYITKSKDYDKYIVCFFRDMINEKTVAKKILNAINQKKPEGEEVTMQDVYEQHIFKQIDEELVQIGNKSSGSENSQIRTKEI